MLVDPDEHPSFYKLFFKEGFIDKILMPRAFIKENKSMLAKTCLLKTNEGFFWEAKIVRQKRGYFLCEGEWPQFVEYHRLDLGDVLLFFLIDKSTFQVLPYKQKRYGNLRGKQVFEELSSSSKEDEDEEEEEEEEEQEDEEEEEEPPRKSKKCKSHAIEYLDDNAGESKDSSSCSKDRESPLYSHSGFIMKGGESNGETNKVLYKKKAPRGLKLLLKACQERPANSILGGLKRGRVRRERDPYKPKQPTTAFFVFMEEFRKQFAKSPHNHDICIVGRAGGDRWNQLSEAEKAPYIQVAEKRKVDYKENLRTYYDRKVSKEDKSDKCRSVIVEEEMHDCVLVNTEIGKRKTGAVEEEEAESGSEENGPKKVRSRMVNFNNKDPNFEVVVRKVTDKGQPLKTYLRRKYQREGKEVFCSF